MIPLALTGVGLLALAVVLMALANVAHARNHDRLADALDAAHEALDVAGAAAQQIAAGVPPADVLARAEASPEALDLIRRFKVFAHLSCLVLALALAGCTAQQLADDEARVHQALVVVSQGIDWASSNPDTINLGLDLLLQAKPDDPTLQHAVAKSKAAVAAGDLATAQRVLAGAALLTK